jgi:hypothetical protein
MGREGMYFSNLEENCGQRKMISPKNNRAFVDVVVKICEIFICPTFK